MMNTRLNVKSRKRIAGLLVFLIAALIVGGVIGGIIVGAKMSISRNAEADSKEVQALSSSALYGTRDGKTLTPEGALIIESPDFVPLDCELPAELQEYTYYLCEAYYIDFDFVMALMYAESSFRTDVVSDTDAYGLMQINSVNHEKLTENLGITDFTDPYQNIRAGVYILRGLFEKYDDAAKVLMAYNMGDYGASVLWDKGVYSTTYTNKVLAKADEYKDERAAK